MEKDKQTNAGAINAYIRRHGICLSCLATMWNVPRRFLYAISVGRVTGVRGLSKRILDRVREGGNIPPWERRLGDDDGRR